MLGKEDGRLDELLKELSKWVKGELTLQGKRVGLEHVCRVYIILVSIGEICADVGP